MKDLSQKNALVTGASRGIGVHIARALVGEGVSVGLVARSREGLQRVADELAATAQRTGARVVALPADLEDVARHPALFERMRAELGELDILVNNAGIDRATAYADESPAGIAQMINLDLTVPMQLTRQALPAMLAKRSGHIVNIASLAGKTSSPYVVSYGAAKAGLIQFSLSLRAELRGSGVSASVVCPGFVSAEGMFANHQEDHGVEVPAGVGTSSPQQVAAAVVRAIRSDRAEIIVNPGPIRLVHAVHQLAPDAVARIQERLGITEVFRVIAKGQPSAAPEVARAVGDARQ